MMFHKSTYITSAVREDQWPVIGHAELCMAGRSNVGKSSFINALLNRKNLAYVGKTPGKTRLLNFFEINEKYMLVDVPGYGYASLSGTQLEQFGRMMEQYFARRAELKGLILLVDIRHKPTHDDLQMYQFAKHHELPVLIVATKCDKVSKNQRPKHLKEIREKLELSKDQILVFSSATKEGLEEVQEAILNMFHAKRRTLSQQED